MSDFPVWSTSHEKQTAGFFSALTDRLRRIRTQDKAIEKIRNLRLWMIGVRDDVSDVVEDSDSTLRNRRTFHCGIHSRRFWCCRWHRRVERWHSELLLGVTPAAAPWVAISKEMHVDPINKQDVYCINHQRSRSSKRHILWFSSAISQRRVQSLHRCSNPRPSTFNPSGDSFKGSNRVLEAHKTIWRM